MQNFISEIVLRAKDLVTPAINGIKGAIKGLAVTANGMQGGFAKLSSNASIFASRLRGIGIAATATAGGLAYMLKTEADHAEQLGKTSQAAGISLKELQRLNYAAGQNGVSAEELANSFKFLNKSIGLATADATSEAAIAFASMGLSLTDASGKVKSTDVVFKELSDRFKNSPDGAKKVLTAMTLLGRGGTQLISTLNEGSASLNEQGDRYQKLAHVLTPKEAEDAKKFGDSLRDVSVEFDGIKTAVVQKLLPYIQPLLTKFIDFVAANKDLIATRISDFLIEAGGYLKEFWEGAKKLATELSPLLKAVGGFKGVLEGFIALKIASLVSPLFGIASAIFSMGAAIGAAPFFIIISALGLIGIGVYELNKHFPNLGQTVIDTCTKMGQALSPVKDLVADTLKTASNKVLGTKFETTIAAENKKNMVREVNPVTGKRIVHKSDVSDLIKQKDSSPFTDLLNNMKGAALAPTPQVNVSIQNKATNAKVNVDSVENGYVDIDAAGVIY